LSQPELRPISRRDWMLQAARPKAVALIAAAFVIAGVLAAPLAAAPKDTGPAGSASKAPSPTPNATGALDPADAAKSPPKGTPAEREAAYGARLDQAIAPLRTYSLPDGDAEHLKAAFQSLFAGKVDDAAAHEAKIKDALAKKLVDWYRLRQGHGEAAEYRAFLAQNPDWPSRDLLQRRMEEALFTSGGSTEVLEDYVKGDPKSPAGMAVQASMRLAHGEKEKARELAAKVWREHDLPPNLEHGFLERFGPMLTEADHKWRLDRLLIDDVRYQNERNERAQLAKRVIPLLSKAEQTKAQARLAVFMGSKGAKHKALPTAGKGEDWGVVFHKVQQQRKANKLDEAAKLILTVPTDPNVVVNLDDWWAERQGLAYLALKTGKPKLAYDLVRDAGPLSVNPLNEQQFMAGWIALRYLKDYAKAEKHLAAFAKSADGPLSRSKAHYWLARAYEAKGDRAKAKVEYQAAASERDTFHALLAMQKLEPGRHRLIIDAPAEPTAAQIGRLRNLEPAKAVALAQSAKLSNQISRILLLHVAKLDDSEAWAAITAHLAQAMGDTQTGVRIGKAAIAQGHNLLYYSYPVNALPKYNPLRPPPEPALLLGLARQETEFDSATVSGAGAQGILQVMKDTAKHVCHDYKIKCNQKELVSDASYNTMIASAYVADRMAEFSGSYILGIASYNAGPGRARQWIQEFGDPRGGKVDPLDWIERIPNEETRRYVVKVLSNIQVYRARLGEEATALRLDQDLNRAREASAAPMTDKKGTDTTSNE
jgi:soluble lytic murein transglycosylase